MLKKFFHRVYLYFLKKNELESVFLRTYFQKKFNINVGMYSYGCFDPGRIGSNTKIGRYCSFSGTSRRFNGNHGIDFLSTHAYLYNVNLHLVEKETIQRTECSIGDDVWMGHNAIILPSVKTIGRGAIIGAGAVVTKDVPAYAIVGGNPAKIIKFRFDSHVIEAIEETNWWLLDKEELKIMINENKDMVYQVNKYFTKKLLRS